MFQVGELIVYGNSGVCRVESIGTPDFVGISKGTDYYTLAPYYSSGSKIFTPCDNDRIVMRPVLTKKEAKKLIKEISSISPMSVPDEKKREEQYKEIMKSCDCRQFVSIIKTIYKRKEERLLEGKKITTSDEKYFQMAEDKLYGELAIALEIEKQDVKEYIFSAVKEEKSKLKRKNTSDTEKKSPAKSKEEKTNAGSVTKDRKTTATKTKK